MTMNPLFLDNEHKLVFEKVAMPVKLSDAPEAWQREIASEIFKQVPYLGTYAVNVVIDRVEAERGFAFGSAQVTSKSDAPTPDQQQLPSVRIPIIVKERMLAPLDVFMDGESVYPLTEKRLNEKLFRTATFEPSTRKPSDKGLTEQLYPPTRGSNSMGSSDMLTKFAKTKKANSAEAGRQAYIRRMKSEAAANPTGCGMDKGSSLVETIAPTISEVDADNFVNQIVEDPALSFAASQNETFSKLALAVARPRAGHLKTAQSIVSSIKPTVVQMQKLASGEFLVKWANAGAFAPQEGVVDPQQASSMAGMDVSGMQNGATITVGTEKAKKQSLKEDPFIRITDPGVYLVHDTQSNQKMNGHVLPIVSFEQFPLDLFLFSNDKCHSVQDKIVGIRQDDHQPENLPMVPLAQAQGDGVPVYDVAGKLFALLPMTVHNAAQDPEGMSQIHGETVYGEPIILTPSPGLEAIQQIGDSEYAVPDFVQWHSFQGPATILAGEPGEVDTTSQAQQAPSTVAVGSTGPGEFSMDGQPLAKIATEKKQFLKRAEAEFLLVGMGLSPFDVPGVLRQAEQGKKVKLAGLRPLIPAAAVHEEMVKRAAAKMSPLAYSLRRNLVKEAAVLDDGNTADKVLSLNFLNPENLHTFASYLPDLDSASQKLAETLMASRLGMSQVDEGALERSMRGMESVIEGLRTLQQGELSA